jgi:AAT family amino acid transporter
MMHGAKIRGGRPIDLTQSMLQSRPDMTNFDSIRQRESGLRQQLSARQLTMIAIGGAIGTGLFLGSSLAIRYAGPSVLISYVIAAVISLLLMGCLAEMTAVHPTPGSFGAYAEHYIHPLAGFLVRYAYWSCVVLAVGTEVTAVATYMQYWFPGTPSWIWVVLFSGVLVGVNALNVRVFGTVEYWFSAIKITAIVAFILIGSYVVFYSHPADIGFDNYVSHGGFAPNGPLGTWIAVIPAIFGYLSIEMIAVAAGEAANPQKAVIAAFRATIWRLASFYLLSIALMLAIVPWQAAGTDKSPFVKVMEIIGLPGGAAVLNFVVLIAALSAMNSQLYITTRMMFSLARGGYAPGRFGRLGRTGVPMDALALSCTGIGLATVLSVVQPERAFVLMMSIAIFGALFTWFMIFVTHWFFRRRWVAQGDAPLRFRMWGFPWLTLLGATLMLAVMLTTPFTALFRMTLVTGIPFLALLTAVYLTRYRKEMSHQTA